MVLDGLLQHSQAESSNLILDSVSYEATLRKFFDWCGERGVDEARCGNASLISQAEPLAVGDSLRGLVHVRGRRGPMRMHKVATLATVREKAMLGAFSPLTRDASESYRGRCRYGSPGPDAA